MKKRDYRKSKVGRHPLEPETLMLGYGFDPRLSEGSVKIPIFLTSTFAYKTAEEGKLLFDYMAGRAQPPHGATAGLIYTRFNNPNLQVVEERLAVLEPAAACAVFASGMAAILTSLLATVLPGQSVMRLTPLYGGTGSRRAAHPAWWITRAREPLRLRLARAFAKAERVCAGLAKHPRVEKVFYPGFFAEGSREAAVVPRQCGAYGATFSFTVAGGQPAAFRVLDRLQGFKQAVSLGGTESLACHPASTTHSAVPEADRRAIGISEGLIRLSTGVEAAKDLINDLSKAMAAA